MIKEHETETIMKQYGDSLSSISDLTGSDHNGFSLLFYLWNKHYLHWLSNNPETAILEKEIRFRRKFFKILQMAGPKILKCTQVFENRKLLDNPDTSDKKDDPIRLPDKPVIFAANHGFHDDILATVLAAGRHAYLVWGSLPLLYNTLDGLAVAMVGGICVNRNSKNSRSSFLQKAIRVLESGTDLIIFPEGCWNKTPNKPSLDYWKGVYSISSASQCPVVPIAHYVRDMEILSKKNVIHTVVDDPINLFDMSQQEALFYLRDIISSWRWKMAEQYGQSKRISELKENASSCITWEALLKERLKGVARYDAEVEKRAAFKSKDIILPADVWANIAQITSISAENVKHVLYAQNLLKELTENDFQHRF